MCFKVTSLQVHNVITRVIDCSESGQGRWQQQEQLQQQQQRRSANVSKNQSRVEYNIHLTISYLCIIFIHSGPGAKEEVEEEEKKLNDVRAVAYIIIWYPFYNVRTGTSHTR